MVCPYLKGLLSAFKEVSPFLQCSDESQHLLVMNLIVPFNSTKAS